MKPNKHLIFDGDCAFCRYWIDYWESLSKGTIAYSPYQDVHQKIGTLPVETYQQHVVYFDETGAHLTGAEAVFASLSQVSTSSRWALALYRRFPLFKTLSESAYSFVARHRAFLFRLSKLFFGNSIKAHPTDRLRTLILRGLGVIFSLAFLSLLPQVNLLFGPEGLSPIQEKLSLASQQTTAYWQYISVFWLTGAKGWTLMLFAMLGVGSSLGIVLRKNPTLPLLISWFIYLSFFNLGQPFLSFQWDTLLLEAGALGILLSLLRSSFGGILLYRLLVVRLILGSGLVKLLSGDPAWRSLSALSVHFETQPLPHILSWMAHQVPQLVLKIGCGVMFLIELVLPLAIFLPRRFRLIGFFAMLALQIGIFFTGNYGFFNLLTIVLLFSLLDDDYLPNPSPLFASRLSPLAIRESSPKKDLFLGFITLYFGVSMIGVELNRFFPQAWISKGVQPLIHFVSPLHLSSPYGLFAVMTQTRDEIIIEGSEDGVNWSAYACYFKPHSPEDAPKWIQPHQPRLDWQFWFAALGTYEQNPWLIRLMVGLLRHTPTVHTAFKINPFPDNPPRFIRAKRIRYTMSTLSERSKTGQWWIKQDQGPYTPMISLKI